MTAPTLYNLTSAGDVVGDVHLHWDAVPGASGYEIFSIPNLDTAFSSDPIDVATSSRGPVSTTELRASATDAYIPEPTGSSNYFAVSTVVGGRLVLEDPVIQASPGVATPSTGSAEACDAAGPPSNSVQVFETTPDGTNPLCDLPASQMPATHFTPGRTGAGPAIEVNEKKTFQQMAGFGGTLTDSSAYLLMNDGTGSVNEGAIRELFGPYGEYGAGLDFIRVPIGGNDFSQKTYSGNPTKQNNYSEDDGGFPKGAKTIDQMLANFNINHDEKYLIPVLHAALRIDPSIKLIATPWSAPAWMKCDHPTIPLVHIALDACKHQGTMDGGTLRKGDEALYAAYLTKFLVAYHNLKPAINFDAITVQNEPENSTPTYPSTAMGAGQEEEVIEDLHADLRDAHLETKIFGLDHNWNDAPYAKSLLNSSAAPDIAGTAFHCYGGDPSAQVGIERMDRSKGIYETECAVGGYSTPTRPARRSPLRLAVSVPTSSTTLNRR